jgi:hypothetical protein
MPWGYHNVTNLGYGIHWGDTSQMKFNPDLAVQKIVRAIDKLKPMANTDALILMNGIDHAEPEPLGRLLEVQPWVLRDGPERIESGWWDGADVRRDYFVAENPRGEVMWIYRDHRYGIDDGEWFLHGVFA